MYEEEYRKYKHQESNVLHHSDDLDIIEDMLIYAEDHPKFSTSYVDSMKEQAAKKGYLSPAQYNSLVKTYYAFKMDK